MKKTALVTLVISTLLSVTPAFAAYHGCTDVELNLATSFEKNVHSRFLVGDVDQRAWLQAIAYLDDAQLCAGKIDLAKYCQDKLATLLELVPLTSAAAMAGSTSVDVSIEVRREMIQLRTDCDSK